MLAKAQSRTRGERLRTESADTQPITRNGRRAKLAHAFVQPSRLTWKRKPLQCRNGKRLAQLAKVRIGLAASRVNKSELQSRARAANIARTANILEMQRPARGGAVKEDEALA